MWTVRKINKPAITNKDTRSLYVWDPSLTLHCTNTYSVGDHLNKNMVYLYQCSASVSPIHPPPPVLAIHCNAFARANIISCFFKIVPWGMTNFVLYIDVLGQNGHFWLCLPTRVRWTVFSWFAHAGKMDNFFLVCPRGQNGHFWLGLHG